VKPEERTQDFYEGAKSPTNSKDIQVGAATVVYGWAGGISAWRIPGGGYTTDRKTASSIAYEIDRLMSRR
jgi:hypothetical protein